jgi:hypothetical protein
MIQTRYFTTENEALMANGLKGGVSVTLCANTNPPWRAMWEDGQPAPAPEPVFDPPIPPLPEPVRKSRKKASESDE